MRCFSLITSEFPTSNYHRNESRIENNLFLSNAEEIVISDGINWHEFITKSSAVSLTDFVNKHLLGSDHTCD